MLTVSWNQMKPTGKWLWFYEPPVRPPLVESSESAFPPLELRRLADRQRPIERTNEQARKFLQTWQGVAEILDQASADEQRQIIQHFIEVVELTGTTKKKDAGTYSLKLFPEANPTAAEQASKNDHGPSEINLSERPVLTENDSVLQLVGKVPRTQLSQ